MPNVLSPMAGKVIEVLVEVGEEVEDGQEVLMLEAMKMEMPVVAEADGTVASIKAKEGDAVESEQVLIVLE